MSDLGPLYSRLAPDPDSDYGALLPVASNRPGSAAWVQNGADPRLALPDIVRSGLKGWLDLANATHTGALTPEAIGALTTGSAGAGLGLAERGALAAGAARPIPSLAMDEASRFARARETGFRPGLKLYHWTNAPDFPAFAYGDGRAKSLGLPQYGFWAAEDPRFANEMDRLSGLPAGKAGGRIIPLVSRFSKPGSITLEPDISHLEVALNIPKLWGDGYDALRFTNYNTFADGTPTPTWLFRTPNQLRSRFAAFDPARKDSADLLAARAIPGFAVQPPAMPGFRVGARAAADMAY